MAALKRPADHTGLMLSITAALLLLLIQIQSCAGQPGAPLQPEAARLARAASGSKNEPPSRPSVDWSKQRPRFGPDMARNVSVELGKTAYLTCKVFELGDKTVSWLRPRENEILTAGRYTYVGDPRFASINDNASHDWILEIKDVGLNDSTSYECQVSTDPKMSAIINLHVRAAKARIKQGEQFYAPLGADIEFTCDVWPAAASSRQLLAAGELAAGAKQTYWYFNGNLLNYARNAPDNNNNNKNFSIDWEPSSHTSRFRLHALQAADAGNYTCKPTSAEPATIRLHVKKPNKNQSRASHNGHHAHAKEAQRNRQHYGLEPAPSQEHSESASSASSASSGAASALPQPSLLLAWLLGLHLGLMIISAGSQSAARATLAG